MEKKYELLKDDAIKSNWSTLYRIRALRDFNDVKRGDLGGYIEKETNLSHDGNCWVSDNARVFGKARVSGNACVSGTAQVSGNVQVSDNARVSGNACVSGDAKVSDNARVFGEAWVSGDVRVSDNAWVSNNACVSGDACVYGNAKIYSNAYITNINDYIVIGPIGSRNDFTTFYLTKDKEIMVLCGCFNDTIDEFIKAVNKTHANNEMYRTDYIGAIEYIKKKLKSNNIIKNMNY